MNADFERGRDAARTRVRELVTQAIEESSGNGERRQYLHEAPTDPSPQYVFAKLEGRSIRRIVRLDGESRRRATWGIHRIWPDFPIHSLLTTSVSTVKADAARISFSATGEGIVWAVLDSGIDETHPHFRLHENILRDPATPHQNFVGNTEAGALVDEFGHGTDVAGIIAGEMRAEPARGRRKKREIRMLTRFRNEADKSSEEIEHPAVVAGIGPSTKLLSLKVLDNQGNGKASSVLQALEYIQKVNDNGRRIRIHGVNLSAGYGFDPAWFACGQSSACVEVDRLVRSGVVVVVAAGNDGHGYQTVEGKTTTVRAGLPLRPGGDWATTVGGRRC